MTSSSQPNSTPLVASGQSPSSTTRTADGLDPSSYTAQRLQHASPAHLHATTRRCFIGPIPEAWLSKHRKSWYKYRPHLSTYSSRATTFNAGDNVSDARQLSGLDEASQPEDPHGVSFPQPDDVNDSDLGEQQIDGQSLPPMAPLTAVSPDERIPDHSRQVSFGASTTIPQKQSKGGSRTTPSMRPQSGKSRKVSTISDGVGRFVTTRERLDATSGPAVRSINATDSTSSLLRQASDGYSTSQSAADKPLKANPESNVESDRQDVTSEATSPILVPRQDDYRQSQIDSLPGASDQMDGTTPSALREVAPVSTGLVRFNIPEQDNAFAVQHINGAGGRTKRSLRGMLGPKPKPGQLVKAERMLVKVDWTVHTVEDDYTENDSLKMESRAVEKWREFIVVCRKSVGDSEDFVLQMTKTRVIPSMEKNHAKKRFAHEIALNKRTTKISMFSSLDKTIAVWTSWKKGSRIFILRPSSSASSVEWFTFLNSALGWERTSSLTVHVPDLNVSMELANPFEALQDPKNYRNNTGHGNVPSSQTAEGVASKDITDRCLKLLESSPVADAVNAWTQSGRKIGLAWKRYDRLEWVHGANESRMYGSLAMQKSHDLELRPKEHYPTQAAHSKKDKPAVEEPPPVEGFLVRLTSQKGRQSRYGKTFFKRLYFSTHDQYLCSCLPGKAMPPRPLKMPRGPKNQILKVSELAEKVPLIYAVNPYPVTNGKLTWLRGDTAASTKKEYDQYAFEESERTIRNLLDAQAYINLCHVVHVRKIRPGVIPSPDQAETRDQVDGEASVDEETDDESAAAVQEAEARTFELVLKNGLTIRLQAYDKLARKEWVKRLRHLVDYWKLRTAQNMDLYKSVRHQNQDALDVDEQMESLLGQFAQKWEVTRSIASPELFNLCGISCCRSITMSSVLYRKPSLHSNFERCSVMLCHGKLLIFQSTLRKHSGKEIPHIHHERQEVIELKDTYVYSGLITEGDLLYQNKTFDSNHPGHHVLPRVFLEDNWTSSDEDTMTCFVVWHSKSKSLFKANAKQDGGKVKQNLRYVSSLGTPGRSMLFKARSRAERDHWVMNLSMEIERLQEGADIRVVDKK